MTLRKMLSPRSPSASLSTGTVRSPVALYYNTDYADIATPVRAGRLRMLDSG